MSELLADHTTTRVGGPARAWVTARTEAEAIEAVRAADAAGEPLFVLGGGSNTLMADAGFPGTVVRLAFEGIHVLDGPLPGEGETPPAGDGARSADHEGEAVVVRIAAGHPWDDAVAWTVAHGLGGIEALSGIPGSAGATPVQNVGAYGADVSQVLVALRAWDREAGDVVELTPADLRFGYRDSVIKRSMLETGAPSPRWIVLSIDLRLRRASSDAEPTAPVRYGQLAAALDVEEGAHAPLAVVRREVLALRAAKGMVSDPADPDTWSTGSYFTNPIVPASVRASLPEGAPAFAAGEAEDGTPLVKLSAAWLIDRAGFAKGFGLPEVAPREGGPDGRGADGTGLAGGRASVSMKHTLAMTNRGDASTEDVLTIARTVRDGVRERFGVELHPEPMIIGTSL
ncbi:UDP-N-acetylmuramate dehydrogenase [Micrococcus luteus]|uniref:UDP-N-acetylmuramate dehydrogenase n=1 Tax=Micrococcus luteus TaxID=1270 RepID=UPI00044E6666|nr:UDP-N-acetylmuramate dehydrogenase [Micrococcus luteus]EZP38137.1 UDP-N-acetylenolpyruvoylglucosamine reductase [Micrococcus luteus]MCV7529992.1 UDP-N-acetylmuramate dehydrogenase [Micrococcus luteus]VWX50094.1 UDP-N-acetylenolpyruvoylglucosamine reductase [Micrococcus luteus]